MTDSTEFDPTAPLPGPPEPWAGSTMPPVRAEPPYLMTEMIDAEPAFAERLLQRLAEDDALAGLVREVRAAADSGIPIVLTGCGTSEHGAMGAADILRDALQRSRLANGEDAEAPAPVIEVEQAFELALEPRPGALVIGISHEGGTWATNRALAAARAVGSRTALITVGTGSPGAALADIVVSTKEQDQAWCHTVGYISPLLVASAVGAALTDEPLDPVAVRALLAEGQDAGRIAAAEAVASAFAGIDRLLIVASGVDRTSAREFALKVEEGTHLPATARDLETLLHGHLAAADDHTGLVLILADRLGREERVSRARRALAAVREIDVTAAVLIAESIAEEIDPSLATAGRMPLPEALGLPRPVAALLGAAVPFQLVTERLARVRGVNPDTLRRTEAAYARSAGRLG